MRFQFHPFSIHLKILRFSGCTFSAKLARLRGHHPQHPPHHRHHPHQCPPRMRMMQVMPGMLSTMGTPTADHALYFCPAPSWAHPYKGRRISGFVQAIFGGFLSISPRSQKTSVFWGAAGPIPEGRPSGPRPSAVSRTTGSEAPRWPDLHADATQPATGHLALPVLSLPFPVSPIGRC